MSFLFLWQSELVVELECVRCALYRLSKWHPSSDLMDAFVWNFSFCLWQRWRSTQFFSMPLHPIDSREEEQKIPTDAWKTIARSGGCCDVSISIKTFGFLFAAMCVEKRRHERKTIKKKNQFNRNDRKPFGICAIGVHARCISYAENVQAPNSPYKIVPFEGLHLFLFPFAACVLGMERVAVLHPAHPQHTYDRGRVADSHAKMLSFFPLLRSPNEFCADVDFFAHRRSIKIISFFAFFCSLSLVRFTSPAFELHSVSSMRWICDKKASTAYFDACVVKNRNRQAPQPISQVRRSPSRPVFTNCHWLIFFYSCMSRMTRKLHSFHTLTPCVCLIACALEVVVDVAPWSGHRIRRVCFQCVIRIYNFFRSASSQFAHILFCCCVYEMHTACTVHLLHTDNRAHHRAQKIRIFRSNNNATATTTTKNPSAN